MDFQFNRRHAQLSLSNGDYLISSPRPRNEHIQESTTPKYYFELELNCNPVCQQEFLELQESKYPENTNITASLLNFDYPYADLVEVERDNQYMKYVFSVTLLREHWQHKISLHAFIPEFIHALNKNNLRTKLEFEEEFGCYLNVTLKLPPTSNLQSRIKTISRKMSNTQQQVLLEMSE